MDSMSHIMTLDPRRSRDAGRRLRDIARQDFERLQAQLAAIDLAGATLLITGATGFFGAWLLALLDHLAASSAPGVRVYAVSRDPEAFLARHAWARSLPWLEWIRGDIRDFEFPHGEVDAVVHAATETSAAAAQAPAVLLDSVISGTRRTLDCAAHCGAKRILLVSSGGVYGAQPLTLESIPEDAQIAPSTLNPRNAYGEAKRVMEMLGAIHAQQYGAVVSIARCFTFVGPGLPLNAHFAIGNFIRDALVGDRITIAGDGSAIRSYMYAADLAIWLLRILQHGAGGRAYNVGSESALSIAELARLVARTVAPQCPVLIEGKAVASPVGNRYLPSVRRAHEELGLDNWTEPGLAVLQTAAWAQEVL